MTRMFLLAAALGGLASAAAPPTVKGELSPEPPFVLPPQVAESLKRHEATYARVDADTTDVIRRAELDEKREMTKLRRNQTLVRRRRYTVAIGFLEDVLKDPARHARQPALSAAEEQGVRQALRDYRRRLDDAVKKGLAAAKDPKKK